MKPERKRVVFDTSTIISAMIKPDSIPGHAVQKAILECDVFISDETFVELQSVAFRQKFDRYFSPDGVSRQQFLALYAVKGIRAAVSEFITDCADPKDNKFLSLAVAAKAEFLVSGDKKHLLSMNPYRDIQIVTAARFLQYVKR